VINCGTLDTFILKRKKENSLRIADISRVAIVNRPCEIMTLALRIIGHLKRHGRSINHDRSLMLVLRRGQNRPRCQPALFMGLISVVVFSLGLLKTRC
jgi:hypothetical protein